MNRYVVRRHGKSAYEYSSGHKTKTPVTCFGEKLLWRRRRSPAALNKHDSEWTEGVFVGVSGSSNEVLVSTPDGIVRCRDVRRLVEKDRWDKDFLMKCDMGFEEYLNPTREAREPIVINADVPQIDVPPVEEQAIGTRRMWLKKSDFETHGYTGGCRGCIKMQREDGTRAGHNEACRTRMSDCISGTVEGRSRKAREDARVDGESARDKEKEDSKVLKEQEITNASEAIPDDVMAPVDRPSGTIADEIAISDGNMSDAESLKSRPSSHREVRIESEDQNMSDAESLKSGQAETRDQRTVEMNEEEQYWTFGGHHDDDMSSGNYLSEDELQSRPITPRDRSVRMEPRAPAVQRPASGSNPASPVRPSKKAREEPDDLMSIVNSMNSIAEVDKRIVAKVLMGVSITEVFSPARVTEACKRFGMTPGDAYDIRSGFDLSDPKVQSQVEKKCATDEPDLLIACPPCTDFCLLRNLNIHVHGPEWEAHFLERKAKSIEHVKFCVKLFKQQLARGEYILFEHPSTASSWEEVAELKALLNIDGVEVQLADQCMYGLVTRGSTGNEVMSAKKTT